MKQHLAGFILTTLASVVVADTVAESPDPAGLVEQSLSRLKNTRQFSVTLHIGEERLLDEGLKIRALREAQVTVDRERGFHFTRKGALRDQSVAWDGKKLYVTADRLKAFAVADAPGEFNAVLDFIIHDLGAHLPGADLFYADALEGIMEDVSSVLYLGVAPVDGRNCHYVVGRSKEVDWHLWVGADASPLPCRYMITSKWMAAAPEFDIVFRNWDDAPSIDRATFRPGAPDGYKTIDARQLAAELEKQGDEQ